MEIVVKRSARRKKTIQARMVAGKMEVLAPASISDAALRAHKRSFKSGWRNGSTPRTTSI